MPELPEVETTMNGIRPFLQGQKIHKLVVRERRLRWPIDSNLESIVSGSQVHKLERRSKYILIHLDRGCLISHLGMSGSFRVIESASPPEKHDHFDFINQSGEIIRYRDPRRFGSLLYTDNDPHVHPRLLSLGVEPLSDDFTAQLLYQHSKKRQIPVKTLIMDGKVVVGVGNIYASEALFAAGIHPLRKSARISLPRFELLHKAIVQILTRAIAQGGTTLQDFVGADGAPGYFEQSLAVYGREHQPCQVCGSVIKKAVVAQRSTFYCTQCQT